MSPNLASDFSFWHRVVNFRQQTYRGTIVGVTVDGHLARSCAASCTRSVPNESGHAFGAMCQQAQCAASFLGSLIFDLFRPVP
jgi:hypothetical protein